MARDQRRALADMRAMEEETARVTMRGSGKASAYGGQMIGAGATPSMGLSQFRGGAESCVAEPKKKGGRRRKQPVEDDEDMELEGGFFGAIASASRTAAAAAARAAAQRASQAAAQAARQRASQAAMRQPLLTSQQRAAAQVVRPKPTNVPKGSVFQSTPTGTRVVTQPSRTGVVSAATPAQKAAEAAAARTAANIARSKQRLGAVATQQQRTANLTRVGQAASTGLSRVGTIANVAIPAYMLADYLRQQQQAQQMGDFGYYDDFAGKEDEGVPEFGRPVYEMPSGGQPFNEEVFAEEEEEMMPPTAPQQQMDEMEQIQQQLGLSDAEMSVYIRTGNLPVRRGRQRGSGVLEIKHGGKREKKPLSGRRKERAEIVKKVMRERGVKLGEASRIVKQEGLF